ncbi:MAG: DUF2628 domain-containing protein [Pseudomonadota bacterium]
MSQLLIYTVHINPSLSHPYEKAEFIDEGFSWKAFFFTGFWALYQRLWLPLFFIILFNIGLVFLSKNGATHIGLFAVQLGGNILIGYFANDWLRNKLKKNGYIIADIVTGDSLIKAEQRFFDRYFAIKASEPFMA